VSREIDAFEAMLGNDEAAAASILAGMTPTELHELMRVCLLMASVARNEIVGPADPSEPPDDWWVRYSHQVVQGLKEPK
jgi:hypothetical protein